MPQTPLDGFTIVLPLHPLHRLWLSLGLSTAAALIVGVTVLAVSLSLVEAPPDPAAGCDSWLSIKWDAGCRALVPSISERRNLARRHQLSDAATRDLIRLDLLLPQTRRIAEGAVRDRADRLGGAVRHVALVAAPACLAAALFAMIIAALRMRTIASIRVVVTEQYVELDGRRVAVAALRGCGLSRQRLVLYTDTGEAIFSPRLSAQPAVLRDVRRRIRAQLPGAADTSRRVLHRALHPVLERARL